MAKDAVMDSDGVKQGIDDALYSIAEAVNKLASIEQNLDDTTSNLLIVAIQSQIPNTPLSSAVSLAERAKTTKDDLFKYLFELRAIVTTYRQVL